MAKDNISEWDATAGNNTVIADIDIDENNLPSTINNAIRELMSQVKDAYLGDAAYDSITAGITASATQTIAGATSLTTTINQVTVSATDGDAVALPPNVAGVFCFVANDDAAQTIQVFPNNGTSDSIDGGAADAVDANVIPAGSARLYYALNSTDWRTLFDQTSAPSGVQVFTSSGTWTRPAGVTKALVMCQAGGAGGGGVTATSNNRAAGGGGAGGFAQELLDVSGTSSETVTIGAKGSGVSADTGGSGGTSSFGSLLSATGGTGGGAAGNLGAGGGAAGAGSGGDFNITCGQGGGGVPVANSTMGGKGGASFFADGAGANISGGAVGASAAATAYGAGGQGAMSVSGNATARAGGDGAAGIIVVLEFK